MAVAVQPWAAEMACRWIDGAVLRAAAVAAGRAGASRLGRQAALLNSRRD